jgi:hypothetical protein
MSDLPAYLWAITIVGLAAIPLATSVVLHGGALRAGLGRQRAGLMAAASVVVFGGWFTAAGVIAGRGGFDSQPGHGVPWLPVAFVGFLLALLALSRIPAVSRVLAAPGMVSRLIHPHTYRVVGVVFLIAMALGRLPALFALPAGLGDIAVGMAAPRVARGLADGTGRRAALWFNAFGLADLVVAMGLGALISYRLISVGPSGAPIVELPLALIPTAGVPLLFALHVTSIAALRRTPATKPGSVRTAEMGTPATVEVG